ncbi:MAG: tyrosine-protein phosphatase [Chloroflexota bacterium]
MPHASSEAHTRLVALEGPVNFRDLGGYRATPGRTAWQRIYRSDALTTLTELDQRRLEQLGLRTVIDLRHTNELLREPNAFAGHPAVQLRHGPLLLDEAWIPTSVQGLGNMDLAEMNREMVRGGGDAIALLFHLLADGASYPLVFHCRGGRDRTGLAAALILRAAGVSDEDVLADYLLSNRYLHERVAKLSASLQAEGLDPDEVVERLQLREAYLTAALHLIDRDFGGVPAYLAHLGVQDTELAAFRQHFIHAAPDP